MLFRNRVDIDRFLAFDFVPALDGVTFSGGELISDDIELLRSRPIRATEIRVNGTALTEFPDLGLAQPTEFIVDSNSALAEFSSSLEGRFIGTFSLNPSLSTISAPQATEVLLNLDRLFGSQLCTLNFGDADNAELCQLLETYTCEGTLAVTSGCP